MTKLLSKEVGGYLINFFIKENGELRYGTDYLVKNQHLPQFILETSGEKYFGVLHTGSNTDLDQLVICYKYSPELKSVVCNINTYGKLPSNNDSFPYTLLNPIDIEIMVRNG